jgi:hypothetical protein
MACSLRSLVINQRGDSRNQNAPAKSMPDGMSWTANGMIHCWWFDGKCKETPYCIQSLECVDGRWESSYIDPETYKTTNLPSQFKHAHESTADSRWRDLRDIDWC